MNQDQNDNKQNYDTMDENNHGYASVNENNIETADPIVEIASEQEQPPMPVYRTPAQLAQQTYQMDQMDQMDKEKQETNSYVYTGQPMETIKPETDRRRQDKRKSKKERGNGSKFFLVITLGIFFGIFAALAFQATSHFTKVIFGEEIETKIEATPELPIIEQQAPIVDDGFVSQPKNFVSTDVTAVVEKAMPSVVAITNLSVQQVEDFFGGVQSQEIASSGSGIIIGENGEELLIITNHHVIESSNTLTVYFVDDEYVEGVVKGSDSNLDLAVIAIPLDQIKDSTREAIRIATLGDSNSLRVGEPAIAIGNALGYGQSVTVGVISAVDRDLQDSELESALIQTDAAINPGNSGGALLNVNGEVIGINTKKVGGTVIEGMGYAIPVSDVSETITKLMTQKTKLTVP